MNRIRLHEDEIEIDVDLVRGSCATQFPEWAGERLTPVASSGPPTLCFGSVATWWCACLSLSGEPSQSSGSMSGYLVSLGRCRSTFPTCSVRGGPGRDTPVRGLSSLGSRASHPEPDRLSEPRSSPPTSPPSCAPSTTSTFPTHLPHIEARWPRWTTRCASASSTWLTSSIRAG